MLLSLVLFLFFPLFYVVFTYSCVSVSFFYKRPVLSMFSTPLLGLLSLHPPVNIDLASVDDWLLPNKHWDHWDRANVHWYNSIFSEIQWMHPDDIPVNCDISKQKHWRVCIDKRLAPRRLSLQRGYPLSLSLSWNETTGIPVEATVIIYQSLKHTSTRLSWGDMGWSVPLTMAKELQRLNYCTAHSLLDLNQITLHSLSSWTEYPGCMTEDANMESLLVLTITSCRAFKPSVKEVHIIKAQGNNILSIRLPKHD